MTKTKEASIRVHGFEFKHINEFRGHEGEPLEHADLYYKGEKVGFVSEHSHGGIVPDTCISDREIRDKFEEAGEKLVESLNSTFHPVSLITHTLFSLESFLESPLKFAKKHNLSPEEVNTVCVLDTSYEGEGYDEDLLDTKAVVSYIASNKEGLSKILAELKENGEEKVIVLEGKDIFGDEIGLTEYEVTTL